MICCLISRLRAEWIISLHKDIIMKIWLIFRLLQKKKANRSDNLMKMHFILWFTIFALALRIHICICPAKICPCSRISVHICRVLNFFLANTFQFLHHSTKPDLSPYETYQAQLAHFLLASPRQPVEKINWIFFLTVIKLIDVHYLHWHNRKNEMLLDQMLRPSPCIPCTMSKVASLVVLRLLSNLHYLSHHPCINQAFLQAIQSRTKGKKD